MKKNSWMTWFIVLAFLMPMGIIIIINIVSPTTFMIQKAVDDMVVSSFDYEKAFSIYVEWFAAFCTILLGIVAATQNNRLQALEEKSVARNDSCNIYVSNNYAPVTSFLTNEIENSYEETKDCICLKFNNYSEPFLKEIEIFFDSVQFRSYLTLTKDNEKIYSIKLPKQEYYVNKKCNIIFTSCYNVKTYGEFKISTKNNIGNLKNIIYYHFYGTEQPK